MHSLTLQKCGRSGPSWGSLAGATGHLSPLSGYPVAPSDPVVQTGTQQNKGADICPIPLILPAPFPCSRILPRHSILLGPLISLFVPCPLHTQRCRGAPEWAQTCPEVPVWRWDHKTEQQGDLVLQSHCVVVSVSIPRTENDRNLRPKYPYFLRRQKGKRQSISKAPYLACVSEFTGMNFTYSKLELQLLRSHR